MSPWRTFRPAGCWKGARDVSEVLLTFGMADWRCRLRLDARGQEAELSRRFGTRALVDDGLPHTEVRLSLDGARPQIRWEHDGTPGDPAQLLASPEGRRFLPAGDTPSRCYIDSVFGYEPALEQCGETLCVLRPERWPLYLELVMTWLLLRESSLVGLHAAVCAAGDTALLLLGPSGCGKSTLACALAAQGADIFDDESAFFNRLDGRLYVRVRGLALRPGGRVLLDSSPPGEWYQAKPGDLKYAVSLPPPARPCPQDHALLFFLDGFGPPTLAPMPGGEATLRLARGMGYGDPSLPARLEAAAEIISRCPTRRLTVGVPEVTARMLLSFAGGFA